MQNIDMMRMRTYGNAQCKESCWESLNERHSTRGAVGGLRAEAGTQVEVVGKDVGVAVVEKKTKIDEDPKASSRRVCFLRFRYFYTTE